MGAQAWTRVTIGGSLTEEEYDQLLGFVENEFYETIDDDRVARIEDAKIGKFSRLETEGLVSWGEPDEVLEFCREKNLAYIHSYDAASGGDFEPGINAWQPGWDKQRFSDANSSGDPVVSLAELLDVQQEGKELENLIKSKWIFSVTNIPPLTITFDVEEKADAEASQ